MLSPFAAKRRVEAVAQAVRKMVEDEDENEDRKRRESHLPPDALPKPRARVVDHDAPRRLALHADAEERDEHLGRHGRREAYRELDEDDVRDIRQDMPEHYPEMRVAEHLRRLDVCAVAMLHHLGADRSAYADPRREADAEV